MSEISHPPYSKNSNFLLWKQHQLTQDLLDARYQVDQYFVTFVDFCIKSSLVQSAWVTYEYDHKLDQIFEICSHTFESRRLNICVTCKW